MTRLLKWVCIGIDWAVGLLLLFAGTAKAMYPAAFSDLLAFRLTWYPHILAMPSTVLLIALELGLGLALLSRSRLLLVRRLVLALFCFFFLFLGLLIYKGAASICGCYGNLVPMDPRTTVMLDTVVILALLFLESKGRPELPGRWHFKRMVFIAVPVLMCIFVSFLTPWFDPFLVKIKPGFEMKNLPTAAPFSLNLPKQKRLVVIAEQVPPPGVLARLNKHYSDHELVLLKPDGEGEPGREVMLSGVLLPEIGRDFYHQLPTVFRLENRIVLEVWYGAYPDPIQP